MGARRRAVVHEPRSCGDKRKKGGQGQEQSCSSRVWRMHLACSRIYSSVKSFEGCINSVLKIGAFRDER